MAYNCGVGSVKRGVSSVEYSVKCGVRGAKCMLNLNNMSIYIYERDSG